MKITFYHINAFTNKIFCGNPAAVCVLSTWLPDDVLHAIAKENNLPVTAFLVQENGNYYIRWITPEYELDLCGHGTLAAADVILNHIDKKVQSVHLLSRIESLKVLRQGELITLNFPVKPIELCTLPLLTEGLCEVPKAMYQHKNERCIAIFDTEEQIKKLKPVVEILKKLPHRGIIVTAPGDKVDFVSRTFYPQKMVSEDPATGASHCLLAPYWAAQLNKNEFHAKQISARGGEIFCRYEDDRVLISGNAVMYMQGTIDIDV